MTREETLNTRYGEFIDLINCRAIESGSAKQVFKSGPMDIWVFFSFKVRRKAWLQLA
jgi:hypothetical protein